MSLRFASTLTLALLALPVAAAAQEQQPTPTPTPPPLDVRPSDFDLRPQQPRRLPDEPVVRELPNVRATPTPAPQPRAEVVQPVPQQQQQRQPQAQPSAAARREEPRVRATDNAPPPSPDLEVPTTPPVVAPQVESEPGIATSPPSVPSVQSPGGASVEPVEESGGWGWLYWLLGLLVLVGAGIAAFLFMRRRGEVPVESVERIEPYRPAPVERARPPEPAPAPKPVEVPPTAPARAANPMGLVQIVRDRPKPAPAGNENPLGLVTVNPAAKRRAQEQALAEAEARVANAQTRYEYFLPKKRGASEA